MEFPSVPAHFVSDCFLVFLRHWLVLGGLESHVGWSAPLVAMVVVELLVLRVASCLCLGCEEVVSFCFLGSAPRSPLF